MRTTARNAQVLLLGNRATLAALLVVAAFVSHAPPSRADIVVNDLSQLNPIHVREVLTPTSVEDVVAAIRSSRSPIAIGGGRFSMGGQTATDGARQLDMRRMDRVVRFAPENREITVQPGITWRKLQEYIDPYGLSVQIMQTYANFTVGGSLSVNVHGRYVGRGPIVTSVKSIRLVLANGDVVTASPTENGDLFYGAIGGYGGLGVIVEVTLRLDDNVRVERRSVVMPLAAYRAYFDKEVRNNQDMIFHNADLYPNAFDTVRATSYVRTDKPVTIQARLTPQDKGYAADRFVFRVVSEWPGGKWIRQRMVDPLLFRGECVEWRNYEASYDIRELEPASREKSTYVLQEYFVPVDRLEEFVPRMADILRRHHVNAINVSIRHAFPDPGTLLAWARTEVFAYVLYYKQGTSPANRDNVLVWTRDLIDAAIAAGGTYYLPYQVLATKEQFLAAYPGAPRFFGLKARVDPKNMFRNRLLEAYYTSP